MKHLGNNVYVPDDGYKYIAKGDMFCTKIKLGASDSVSNWHDTNDEPPEPQDEPTVEDKAEAHDILMGGGDMKPQERARQLRPLIETAAESLPDEDAVDAVELFPEWAVDIDYTAGFRTQRIGKLYECIQAHRSQANWTPETTPALWKEVAKPGEIPVWKQPTGAQDAFMKGDRVWFPEKDTTVYVSTVDNNVWQPGVYGWEED